MRRRSNEVYVRCLDILTWKNFVCAILQGFLKHRGKYTGNILLTKHGGRGHGRFRNKKIRRMLEAAYASDNIARSILRIIGWEESYVSVSLVFVNALMHLARYGVEPGYTLFNLPRGSMLKVEVLLELVAPWMINGELKYYGYGQSCFRDSAQHALYNIRDFMELQTRLKTSSDSLIHCRRVWNEVDKRWMVPWQVLVMD